MNSNILCEGSSDFIDETEDNQKAIRKMVMDCEIEDIVLKYIYMEIIKICGIIEEST